MSNLNQMRKQFSITTVDTYIIKSGQADGNTPSIRTIEITSVGATGSMLVKARPRGSAAAFVAIVYEKLFLNGAVGDGTLVATAITGSSLLRVDDSGLELALDVSALSAGSFTVDTFAATDL